MNDSATVDIAGKAVDLSQFPQYDNHHKVYYIEDKESGLEGFIAIHRVNNGHPSFGATRMWPYKNRVDALGDALRLSRLMTYKSALAGLPCGGAKAVIIADSNSDNKSEVLKAYADKVNELKGKFVTGTDVGLTQKDIKVLDSKYFVGLRVNPTDYTALGLVEATRAAFEHVFGTPSFSRRSFAIQGVGKIGTKFLELIYQDAGEILVTDVDMRRLRQIKEKYPRVHVVDSEEIHKQEVDVFSPCALSAAINEKNVCEIRSKIIIGGANSQLENSSIETKLSKQGIIYIPDYVANAGGLISVYNEYDGKDLEPEDLMDSMIAIGDRVREILNQSKKENTQSGVVANNMVEKVIHLYVGT